MTWGAWLCLLSPLFATIVILLGGTQLTRRTAAWIATTSVFVAFGGAVAAFLGVHSQHVTQSVSCGEFGLHCQARGELTTAWTWLAGGHFSVGLQLLVDPLSTVMMLIVSGVGALFIAMLSRPAAGRAPTTRTAATSRTSRSSSSSIGSCSSRAGTSLLLLVGWGLARPFVVPADRLLARAAERRVRATKKAFVMNAVGAVSRRWRSPCSSSSAAHALALARPASTSPTGSTANWVALGLLGGAAAKSAQIPLQTWLPDAMEGPTPVSALIHAATMVTAGVYLIARTHVIFEQARTIELIAAGTGALTPVVAGLIALVQTDIKRGDRAFDDVARSATCSSASGSRCLLERRCSTS